MGSHDSSIERDWEQAQVECYSGHKVNERPVAFSVRNRRREISEILDRWYEVGAKPDAPIVDYFKIKTDDGSVLILRYVSQSDEWAVRVLGEK